MKVLKSLQDRIRGWLPKETIAVYMNKSKPRWRKSSQIALTLISVISLAFAVYVGVQTFIRYSNPLADVTASYFEKSLNCTTAKLGDVVEVNVRVYWHGYAIPEFKREVKINDPYSEGNFELIEGNNTCQYVGYGGDNNFRYLLKVTSSNVGFIELPKPRLYLDKTEIPLYNESQSFEAWKC